MKRYIFGIVFFFVAMAAIDRGVGAVCDYLNAHVRGGARLCQYTVYNKVEADVLVLGSSRANHHYDSQMIEDSLGLSTFNCGYDGLGTLNSYARYMMCFRRHKPHIVILDIFPGPDLFDHGLPRFTTEMKPYADEPVIRELFDDVSPGEHWKLYSKLYRYNTTIFQILHDDLIPSSNINKGFDPLNKTLDYEPEPYKDLALTDSVDAVKIRYVEKIIRHAHDNGVRLYVVASPFYKCVQTREFDAVIALCKRYGATWLNYYTDPALGHDRSLYADATHMNARGAHVFTQRLLRDMKCRGIGHSE